MTPFRCPLSVPECDEACGQCPSLGEVAADERVERDRVRRIDFALEET